MLIYGLDLALQPQLLHIYDVTLTGIIAVFTALLASFIVT